jgi:FAD/FMN-containing dehydrogenase
MTSVQVSDAALSDLRSGFGGQIILPSDDSYDENRTVFNGMIDRRPSVIAQCANATDVGKAIAFGRELSLEIAVRGGGHGVAGKALTDDGIVIDLRRMNGVVVDPEARMATVAGGATMSHLDRATEPYGLATTGGRVSTTGVGGFTLGGGSGWLERKFGLACDNLLGAELVTADGSVVRASEDENQELFWALHGGGGNFGVATSLMFRLHSVPVVTAAFLFFRPERGPEVISAFRDLIASAPDDIAGGAFYVTGSPEDFVPDDLVGNLALLVVVTYTGSEDEARAAMRPMLQLAPAGEMIAEMPYADLQCAMDDPPGHRNYWSAEHLDALPGEAIDRFCARADQMIVPSPSQHVVFPLGGAVDRGRQDYPIPWRKSPWVVHPFAVWDDPADDDRAKRWTRDIRADLEPWASGAVYLNFIGDEGRDRVVAGFGAQNYERLVAVKTQFDPDNVFRLNHNIEPGSES